MKYLSILFIISLNSCFCFGQIHENKILDSVIKEMRERNLSTGTTSTIFGTAINTQIKYSLDTVKCIMLVCDTTSGFGFTLSDTLAKIYNQHPFWIFGFDVREKHSEAEFSIDWYFDHQRPPGYFFVHKYFLYDDKTEINKIIIWLSKTIGE